MQNYLKYVAYINVLFSQMIFFSVYTLFGLTYKGVGESAVYLLYLVGSSLLAYFLIIKNLLSVTGYKFSFYVLLLLPILIVLSFLIVPNHDFVNKQVILFFVMVLPTIFIGYIMARDPNKVDVFKLSTFVALVVALSVLRVVPTVISMSVVDLVDVFGGGQYQAFSYFCSLAFLIILRQYLHYKLVWWKKLGSIFTLLVLFAGVILSGGRGGLLVILLGLTIFLIKYKGYLFLFKYFLIVVGAVTLLITYSKNFDWEYSDRINQSFDRLFSFISSDGINMEGSSNRDEFYNVALSMIQDSPIFGYGFFGTADYLGEFYPHNFFLEVLLHGGFLYLIFWCIILIVYILNIRNLISLGGENDFVLITAIYSGTLLMFSSSYLQEPLFWFSLAYVFSVRYNNLISEKEKYPHTNFRISEPQ